MFFWLNVIVFIFAVSAAWGCLSAAPWVPARKGDVERAVKLAGIAPGQSFIDLGCGDGRVASAAALAGARAEGCEISLFPYLLALIRVLFLPKGRRPKIRLGNFWTKDLKEFDIVYGFLLPAVMPRLKAKLEKELKPGSRVITYVWPIPGWEAAKTDSSSSRLKICLYQR